jgi:exonuclease III
MLILNQNVYWFQGYPAGDPEKIELNQNVFQKLISIYKSIAPDIIFLQEIQSTDVAQLTATALNMNYFYTPGEEINRYGGLVLYQKNLELKLLKLNLAVQFQRFYQLVELQIQNKTFRLCNVHLPSNAQLSEEQALEKRRQELQAIFNSSFPPDLICGDLNENENQNTPSVNFVLGQKYFDAISHNTQANRNTKIKGKRGDYIFLKNDCASILKSFYTIDLEDYKIKNNDAFHLSDHFPICVELGVARGFKVNS